MLCTSLYADGYLGSQPLDGHFGVRICRHANGDLICSEARVHEELAGLEALIAQIYEVLIFKLPRIGNGARIGGAVRHVSAGAQLS